MGTEIRTWEIIDDKLTSIDTTLAENNRRETEHLEKWLKTQPKICLLYTSPSPRDRG